MAGHPLSDPELLARLVAFDSTSHKSNLPIADFLADYLDRPGIRTVRHLSPDGTKANLVAWVGPEPDGRRRGLVLSGHMDVVPADEEGWQSDPFTLTDRGDRYVARGACDMKGFLAIAANLATEIPAGGLEAPLALVFTYDEEVGTLGARHLLDTFAPAGTLPVNAVIGEPTSLVVARAHKGHLKLRITLHGRSAHSAYPHLGANAIEPAGRIIVALERLRRDLESAVMPHRELFPEVPYIPLNVATVHGGAAINIVPDRCAVEVGLRPLPDCCSPDLCDTVSRLAREAAAPFEPEITLVSDSPALLLPENAPIHIFLRGLLEQDAPATVSFATDAGWLQRMGLDCAIFGPGSIAVAHRPNEYVPKAELAAARTLLLRTIGHFCGRPA
ncbi:MAG: acetylornithine deacetylase [Acidobacteriota bacterium]|nr:acetylornithine deacetylase [Acidobacteriota bacterium]